MGQEARHPMLVRLRHVLEAKGARDAARRVTLVETYCRGSDDMVVRSLIMRHCREYGIDPCCVLGDGVADLPPDGVALTPVLGMASTNPYTGRWQRSEIERIALSATLLGPTRFVTRMDTRALEPRIRLGAYLIVDTTQDLPPAKSTEPPQTAEQEGAPFALDIQGEGLVVRLTRYDEVRDAWELATLDRSIPAMAFSRQATCCHLVGRVVWVAQEL